MNYEEKYYNLLAFFYAVETRVTDKGYRRIFTDKELLEEIKELTIKHAKEGNIKIRDNI